MWILTIVLGAITACLAFLYRHRRKQHNLFHEIGISGPEPHWLFGNLKEFASKPMYKVIQGWTKQYGQTYGYYEGPTPIIMTTDLELIKQVFVKQFASFHNRKPFPFQADAEKDANIHIVTARGARWKRLRSIINPTFSSAKMKQMYPIFNERITVLMTKLEDASKDGKPFDIYSLFQKLTLDLICRCAFGMEVNALEDPTDPFLSRCQRVFDNFGEQKFLSLFPMLFPEMRTMFTKLFRLRRHFQEEPALWIADNIEKIVKMRREQSYHTTDLLQLMMESEDASAMESPSAWTMTAEQTSDKKDTDGAPSDQAETKSSGSTANGSDMRNVKRKLTNSEIKMQGMLFLLAGYETTSTALGYTAYELALNPQVQKKLQEEIDTHIGKDEPSYEKVHGLQYLDMVLNESLRLYPIASIIVARQCMEACDINSLHIPVGAIVHADVWSIHKDPELWGPDTHKFDPERFTAERKATRHPMAWLPFGAGPRNCVGLRFGVMEAKTALTRILQKYTIEQCEETEVPLELQERATITPKNGVTVKLTLRQ